LFLGLVSKSRQKIRSESTSKQRRESESSEADCGGESTSRASSSAALEEVAGVQPEVQKTPRKIDGIKGF
jgi:hypothetical protein